MKAGASGFLLKDAPRDQLVGAVRTVAAGDALLAPTLVRRLIEDFVRRPAPGARPSAELDDLTERELEVLTLIARGLANAEIAARLFVSEATVRTHVTHILAKLGLRDRVQAVVLAYETGLGAARRLTPPNRKRSASTGLPRRCRLVPPQRSDWAPIGLPPAFRWNAAPRVYSVEVAHNPEVARARRPGVFVTSRSGLKVGEEFAHRTARARASFRLRRRIRTRRAGVRGGRDRRLDGLAKKSTSRSPTERA